MNYLMLKEPTVDMQAFRLGNKYVFKQVFDKYHRVLLFHVLKRIKCMAEAEDIVSESFVKLHDQCKKISTEEHIMGFLFKVARNNATDKIRTRKRVSLREEEYARLCSEVSPQLIEHEMIKAEEIRRLYASLKRLPPKNQEIITLYLKGLSCKEIAIRQNTSLSNVIHHIRNGAYKLRKELCPNEVSEMNTIIPQPVDLFEKKNHFFFNKQPLARII